MGSDPAVCTRGPRNQDPPERKSVAWGLGYSKGSLPSISVHKAWQNGAAFMPLTLSIYILFRKVQPKDLLLWIGFLTFRSQEQNFLEMLIYTQAATWD